MATKAAVKVSYTINGGPTYIAKVNKKAPIEVDDAAGHFASTSLKPCLSAILLSRPELLEDSADYSICVLDQQETEAVRLRRDEAKRTGHPVSPVKASGDKIWEGKGLLSWVMQEDDASIADEDSDNSVVCGKLSGPTLNVTLAFMQRNTISRTSFLDQLRAPSPLPSTSRSVSPQPAPPSTSNTSLAPSAPAGLFPTAEPSAANSTSSPLAPQPAFAVNVIHPTPESGAKPPQTRSGVKRKHLSNSPSPVPPNAAPVETPPPPPPPPQQQSQPAPGPTVAAAAGPSQSNAQASSVLPSEPTAAAGTSGKTRKLKFSAEGCINCGVKYALIWRKRKNNAGGGKLCNSCGIHFNQFGSHRTVTLDMREANANGQADHSAEEMPSRPAKQRKTEDDDPSGPLPLSFDPALRRSPRRAASAAQSQPVSASSPGPRGGPPHFGGGGASHLPRSPRRHARDAPTTSSSLFHSIPPSAFDSDFGALGTDLFSTLTSDAPMPDAASSAQFDALFSDADIAKLFSDAPGPADADAYLNSAGTHLLPDLFAGQQLHSDGLNDLPPSSPPRHRARNKLFPDALNAAASESGSPSMGESQADTPQTTVSAAAQSAIPSAVADTMAASGVTWSEEAVNALTNALLQQAAKHGSLDLSEHTLRDLFATFANNASPEGKTPRDGPHPGSTPVVSPSPTEHAAEKSQQVNIKPVGEVNAEVALEIWKNEVRERFNRQSEESQPT